MHEPDQEQQRKHWDELARQLGLPGSEEEGEDRISHAEAHDETAPHFEELPSGLTFAEISGPDESTASEPAKARAEPDVLEYRKPANTEVSAPRPEATPRRLEPEPDERPTRGRRSQERRRPRSEPETPSDETGGEAFTRVHLQGPGPESDEGSPERSRRRRARSRRDDDENNAPEETTPQQVADIPEQHEEEAPDDDVDTLSDWNVPSWQEIITSLYRPER